MPWVTLDDGQKVYIGSHGEFMPRGPGSARQERHARLGTKMAPEKIGGVRERAAAMIRAKRARRAEGKTINPPPSTLHPPPDVPVKSGPQALRDYYAAKSKGGEELTRAKHELLRTKLDQERRQVAATAAASKPAAGMVSKPAIPARSERPNYAKPVVAYKARQMQSDISTARKELAAEMTGQRIRDTAKAAAAARVQAYNASLSPQAAREAKFSLLQRSATGAKAPVNTGRGTTKFMFDMKRGDKPGQTTIFDKLEAKPATAAHMPSAVSAPAKPSLREQVAAARTGAADDRAYAASRLRRLRGEVQSYRSLDAETAVHGATPFKEYGRITPKMRALTEAEGRLSQARKQIGKQLRGRR